MREDDFLIAEERTVSHERNPGGQSFQPHHQVKKDSAQISILGNLKQWNHGKHWQKFQCFCFPPKSKILSQLRTQWQNQGKHIAQMFIQTVGTNLTTPNPIWLVQLCHIWTEWISSFLLFFTFHCFLCDIRPCKSIAMCKSAWSSHIGRFVIKLQQTQLEKWLQFVMHQKMAIKICAREWSLWNSELSCSQFGKSFWGIFQQLTNNCHSELFRCKWITLKQLRKVDFARFWSHIQDIFVQQILFLWITNVVFQFFVFFSDIDHLTNWTYVSLRLLRGDQSLVYNS